MADARHNLEQKPFAKISPRWLREAFEKIWTRLQAALSFGGLPTEQVDITVITGDYTATTSDHTIDVDAADGPITVTLPPHADAYNSVKGAGQVLSITKVDSSTNKVTVTGDATVNGDTNMVMCFQWTSRELTAVTSEWRIT